MKNRIVWMAFVAFITSFVAPYGWSALVVGPFLQEMAPDGVTVVWETQEEVIGTVQIGQNEFERSASDAKPTKIHRIRLNGLKASTLYSYRCRWNDQITDTFTIKTAPPRGGDGVKLAVIGGTSGNLETTTRLVAQLSKTQSDLIFHAGGMVSQPTSAMAWKNQFLKPFGNLISMTPFECLLTNFNQRPIPFAYLGVDKTYNSFEYGNILVVRLDDSLTGESAQTQIQWLEETLRTTQQKWAIVFFQDPLFSAKPTRSISSNRWQWQPILQKYRVDLAISSADHFYHRSYPIGYVEGYPQYGVCHINAGGGAALEPSVLYDYTAFRESRYHFLTIETQGDRLLVRAIDENGRGFDSFVRDKNGGSSANEFVSFEMMELQRDLQNWADKTFYNWSTIEFHGEAKMPTAFQIPLRGTLTWEGGADWTIQPRSQQNLRIAPQSDFTFNFTAAYTRLEQIFPLPQLHFQLEYDAYLQDYRNPLRGFRNHKISLSPLQVVKPTAYEIPKASGRIDRAGSVEPSWAKALYVDELFINKTGAAPKHTTRVGFLHDGAFIYIYAKMLQDPSFVPRSSAYNGLDSSVLFGNEHLRFSLRNGQDVFTFLLSSNGETLESKNGDTSWNVEWDAAAVLATDAWEAEIKIPISEIAGGANGLRMNIARYDALANETSTLIPSFARSGSDALHMATVTFAP